jgi:hypothetical protein
MERTRADLRGLQQVPTPQVLSCCRAALVRVPQLGPVSWGDFRAEDEEERRPLVAAHRPGRCAPGRGRGLCTEARMLGVLSVRQFAGRKQYLVL